jgi:serine/threonine protein kinase
MNRQSNDTKAKGIKVGEYILEKSIGKGQFGKVFRARHIPTGEVFAIKRLDKNKFSSNPQMMKLLNTEVAIMKEIKHPNILNMYEFIVSRDFYYIVIQYCNQGDLETYMRQRNIKCFDEHKAVQLLKQIFNGFTELRKRKILHRDFKLANIFMSNEHIVIGDFGFAKVGQELAETRLGTPMTMAPELLFSNDDDVIYNAKADLWSIGVVFYQLLFGDPPFWGFSNGELISSIKQNSGPNLKFPKSVSEETKDFLRNVLVIDPKNRLEWSHCFEHPIFNKFPYYEEQVSKLFDALKGLAIGLDSQSNNQQSGSNRLIFDDDVKRFSAERNHGQFPHMFNSNNEHSYSNQSGPRLSHRNNPTKFINTNHNNKFGSKPLFENSTDREFQENKFQNKNLDTVKFYNFNEIRNQTHNIPVKLVEEQSAETKLIQQMENDSVIREIGFRYSHEKNKIYYLIFAVKKMQSGLKTMVLSSAECALYNLCLLLLRKAITTNTDSINSLEHRANILKIHPAHFLNFLSSPFLNELKVSFKDDHKKLTEYYDIIFGRAKGRGVALIPHCLLTNKDYSMPVIDQAISNEINGLMLKLKSNEFSSGTKRKKLLQLLVILKQTIGLDSNFPYFIDRNQAVKFNWGNLYMNIENASESDLNNILHAN